MRPLCLTISAFGPYAEEQVIDFRLLGNKRFFLIHGPTGGGKTTVLDALCYALYGDTSGNERNGEQMRSQMARPERATSVRLDFCIGAKQYRVVRRPPQVRPRLRGEGDPVRDAHSATLWDRTDAADDVEGEPLETQPSRVTARVEALLGFRSEQFRQVIMLPQGKFRELLLADSSAREDILQTLFRTGFYERAQDALKERAREVAMEVANVRSRQNFVLKQANAPDREELMSRHAEKSRKHVIVAQELTTLRETEEESRKRYATDQQVHSRFGEYRTASAALKGIQSKATVIDQKRASIGAAERASRVRTEESALAEKERDARTRKTALLSAVETERKSKQVFRIAKEKLLQAEAKKGERDRLATAVAQIEGLWQKVQRLEQSAGDAKQASARLGACASDLARAKNARDQAQRKTEQATVDYDRAARTATALEGHRLAVEKARRAVSERSKLSAAQVMIVAHESTLDRARQKHEEAKTRLLQVKAESADVQRAWIDGQAARLARELEQGEPCPVCGSTEHPAPAQHAGGVPSDGDLQAAQDVVDRKATAVSMTWESVQKLDGDLATAKSQAEALRASLDEAAEEVVETLQEQLNAAELFMQQAEAAKKLLPTLQAAVAAASASASAAKQHLEQVDLGHQTALAADIALQATLAECQQGVPEQFRTIHALDTEAVRMRGLVADIDADLKTAQADEQQAAQSLSAAVASLTMANSEADAAIEVANLARDGFARKLTECGFASDAELKAAKLAEAQVDALRETVAEYDRQRNSAQDREERARSEINRVVEPDLAASKLAADAATVALERGITRANDIRRDVEQIEGWLREMSDCAKELEQLDTRYAVVGRLAEVADGKNGSGIKFNRFVLGFLLDDVLIAATERLKIMSKGRYQLQRRRERADLRTHGGLDLEVFDAYSGYSRAAATLSGGEGFLASLSLALGLADVVQAQSGGLHMETMFIDEGFGTLDSETLHLAIQTLIDLFKDGRLVGIISHVAELQEYIHARLEVKQTQRGSFATFVLN